MNTFQIEVAVMVEDFFDAELVDTEGYSTAADTAFETASQEGHLMAEELFCEMYKGQFEEVMSASFVEFDSSNVSHASAIFVVEYKAHKSITE